MILGLNGWVWVSAGTGHAGDGGQVGANGQGDGLDAEGVYSNINDVSDALPDVCLFDKLRYRQISARISMLTH